MTALLLIFAAVRDIAETIVGLALLLVLLPFVLSLDADERRL